MLKKEEINELITTLAHDLKNPLGAIFAYSDILLDTGLGSSLTEAQKSIILRIKSTSFRALEMARNFQYLSYNFERIDGVNIPGEKEINVVGSIDDIIKSIFHGENSPHVDFSDLDSTISLRINPALFERLFTNLYINALKFSPATEPITISVKKVPSRTVAISIHNFGPIIPESDRQNLFKLHAAFDGDSKTSHGGAGIGLYIVKKIVDMYKGDITVSSDEASGTEFVVTL